MLLSQKRLRQILGVLWVSDGLLQIQPQMFTMNMINGVMVPIAHGQPSLIARNLHWIIQLTTQHLTLINIGIALVQVSIGVLLVSGLYVRQAVVASALWALGVWYAGEGMGMLLTGRAGVLTGAPGAVLLYPLIGFVVYPRHTSANHLTVENYPGLLSRHQLQLIFGGLWLFYAVLQLQPYWWQGGQIGAAVLSMVGMGGWDTVLLDPSLNALATHVVHDEIVLNASLIVICLSLGVGILFADGQSLPPLLLAAALASFAVWFAEAFGGVLTGMSTDFNTGLLLILIALACWSVPVRQQAGEHVASDR